MKEDKVDKYMPFVGFIDLLLATVVIMMASFMISTALINISKKKNEAEHEGKYVIVADWTSGVDADVDLWVKGPNDERSGFFSRDVGSMSLLRDDLGSTNDKFVNAYGQVEINPVNREEVTIRTPQVGEYLVNVHYFRAGADVPPAGVHVTVQLKVVKTNEVLGKSELVLEGSGQEKTALKFTLDNTQNVSKIDSNPLTVPWVVRRGIGGSP